jgi:hypothetical protein
MIKNALIYIIVFLCGWVLMTVEILGGRMLAPVFGSGIEVWGSIIGVFLLSLSLGYFLGGILSQIMASIFVLLKIVAFAGILIAILPLYYDELTIKLWNFGPRLGPLTSSILLFFPPSVLLGMVSPYSIHLSTSSITSVGVNSGLLYATSTVGSFLGCIITAFYFITMMGITKILFVSGLLLILVALLGYLCSYRLKLIEDQQQ